MRPLDEIARGHVEKIIKNRLCMWWQINAIFYVRLEQLAHSFIEFSGQTVEIRFDMGFLIDYVVIFCVIFSLKLSNKLENNKWF